MPPPQLLEDALNYQLESFIRGFADQSITLEFSQADCNDMLLVRQSAAENSIWKPVHCLRCWVLRYADLAWHIKNYVPGRQAWHYVAEAHQHQRRAVLSGIHMSTAGVIMREEMEETTPTRARKSALAKAAKAEAQGSKFFAGTSLDTASRKQERVRSRSC